MTKKHFDALACALRASRPLPGSTENMLAAMRAWRCACQSVASACAKFNPKFDRARFLGACEGSDRVDSAR